MVLQKTSGWSVSSVHRKKIKLDLWILSPWIYDPVPVTIFSTVKLENEMEKKGFENNRMSLIILRDSRDIQKKILFQPSLKFLRFTNRFSNSNCQVIVQYINIDKGTGVKIFNRSTNLNCR